MLPFLNIYGVKIPMYGVMTALGYAAAIWYCLKRRQQLGITKDQVLDIIFYLIAGAAVGGKIFYILFYWQDFANALWLDKIRYGFVFLGGFIGAAAAGLYILNRLKIPVLRGADFFVQAVPLGHAIGKIGCFLAGCCYGKVSHISFLSVRFNNPQCLVPLDLRGVGLYPIQLIEAAVYLGLFFALYKLSEAKHKAGTILAAYLIGFGIIRFIVEFLRGEDELFILGIITQNQITALALVIIGAAFIWWRDKLHANSK